MGSPPGGPPFWKPKFGKDKHFITGAKAFFNDQQVLLPATDYPFFCNNRYRINVGKIFATALLDQLNISDTLHFVTHSMGCAFAEGIMKTLAENSYSIGKVVHINCYQAGELSVQTSRIWTVDYQMIDDPLINNRFLKLAGFARPGRIAGADYTVHEKSGIQNPLFRHRGPMGFQGDHFWKNLVQKMTACDKK